MKKLLLVVLASTMILSLSASVPAGEQKGEKSAHCQCKNCTCNPCTCTAQKSTCCDVKGDCGSDCGKVAVTNEAVTKAQAQQS